MTVLSLLLSFALTASLASAEAQIPLKITVEDVHSAEGEIVISVYRPQDDFPRRGSYKSWRIKAEAPVTEKMIELPAGRYAIAVYHDEDANGHVNKNFIGIPREGVGISNNAIKGISRPKFEDAAFDLDAEKAITIDLTHY